MKRSTWISALATFLFALPLLFLTETSAAEETAQPAYAEGGAQQCLMCHDTAPTNLVLGTSHGQKADPRSPFASHECESCHGAGSAHMDNVMDVKPAIRFGANSPTPVAEQNGACLGCHEGGMRKDWAGSRHDSSGTACASCHNVHAKSDPVLTRKTQAKTCYGCHTEQRAQAHSRSRHPIKEGKVACSDCHNPHGSTGPTLLKEASVNETCYSCHAEKRGPFLWEHAPVRRDCTNCHTPHGSNNPGLLRTKGSFVCLACHQYGGHVDLPRYNRQSATIGQGCINCHSTIHGSNHPSGVKFTR